MEAPGTPAHPSSHSRHRAASFRKQPAASWIAANVAGGGADPIASVTPSKNATDEAAVQMVDLENEQSA